MHTTDRVRVAAQAMLSPRTVDRAYAGANIYATTRARIVQSAEALELAATLQPVQDRKRVAGPSPRRTKGAQPSQAGAHVQRDNLCTRYTTPTPYASRPRGRPRAARVAPQPPGRRRRRGRACRLTALRAR